MGASRSRSVSVMVSGTVSRPSSIPNTSGIFHSLFHKGLGIHLGLRDLLGQSLVSSSCLPVREREELLLGTYVLYMVPSVCHFV